MSAYTAIRRLLGIEDPAPPPLRALDHARQYQPANNPDGREFHFLVRYEDALPATVAEITRRLQLDLPPTGALLQEYATARRLPAEAWEYALRPERKTPAEGQAPRAVAMNTARRWFTEQLHQEIGGRPMAVRWTMDTDAWRYPSVG
jgi:hypothetical protein